MVAFPFRLPSGFPGQVTRSQAPANVEAGQYNAASMPAAFGVAVQEDANGVRALTAADLLINSFLVRPYPTSGNGTDGLGVATPQAAIPASKLKSGYMLCKLGGSAPAARNGAVFIRVGNLGGAKVLGQPEAAADFSSGLVAAAGANTGNGTCVPDATTPLLANYKAGAYKLLFTSATAWTLTDPNGNSLPPGANGTANASEIKFLTAAGGTPFVAGDSFTLTVSPPTIALDPRTSYFTGPADAAGIVEVAYNI